MIIELILSHLFDIHPDTKDAAIAIPIFGRIKASLIQFIAGVVAEILFIFILVPFRWAILSIFFQHLSVGSKWATYVLVACMLSLLFIGLILGSKLVYCAWSLGKSVASSEKKRMVRDQATVKNLVR